MMANVEWSSDLNPSLIEKVRCGKSPTPKDRHDKLSYGLNKSSEDAKIRIQQDILDSLKEKDGIPPLVYPQDYIFDIAHFRTNGNLGDLIDDMSNISNPDEKFEMVRSENRILRERLNNALQREMKAIKTFQKLANENRLLRLKEQGNTKKEKPQLNDTNHEEPHIFMNGTVSLPKNNHDNEHRKHVKLTLDEDNTNLMVSKCTSTSDLTNNSQSKSTSTEDLGGELGYNKEKHEKENKSKRTTSYQRSDLPLDKRKALLKASSSPNILEDVHGCDQGLGKCRARSASCGSQCDESGNYIQMITKSVSSGAINNYSKLGDKKVCSFPSNLDVVDEEADFRDTKKRTSTHIARDSISSESNMSRPCSASSEFDSNSPCPTPTTEMDNSENVQDFASSDSFHIFHMYSKSLPSQLNRGQFPLNANIEVEHDEVDNENNNTKTSLPILKRRATADHILTRPSSAGSTRAFSTGSFGKKTEKKTSSSDDSEEEEKPQQMRRRAGHIETNPNDFVADIRKFQKMLSTGQISHLSHESDNEEDILQACEAVRNQKYNSRRGSSIVQIPASSVQMDLHVTMADEPLDTRENAPSRKNSKQFSGSTLTWEDKRSRWASLLRNKKKLILPKDKVRISEDLKEFLSTKTRPPHIDTETELSLYRDTHWTHFQRVGTKKEKVQQLSDHNNNFLSEKEKKRREAVWELFHSEVVYLTGHLLALKECFLEPLLEIQAKGFLVTIDHRKLFSNLEELCVVSAKFAKDLLRLFKNEQENQFGSTASVVAAFTKFKWTVHPQYERYCLSYTSTLKYLESLKQMQDVQVFFKWCESDPRCNRLKLTDLLVAPFQHLTKYPLLLKNIRKRTSEGDKQHVPLTSTIKSVEVLIQELEGNVTVVRNYRKLKELQKNLIWPSVADLDPKSYIPEFIKGAVLRQECGEFIASPKRQLIYEGPLTLYESAKTDIFVFLFDDMVLLTKSIKKNRHLRKISGGLPQESLGTVSPSQIKRANDFNYSVWKQPIPIDRFVLHDLDDYQGNSIKHGFILVHMSRFKQAIAIHTLQASSKDVKATWISKLKATQNKWNEVIEQEESEEKSTETLEDDTQKNNETEADKSESDSEHENWSNSEHNNSSIEDLQDPFLNEDEDAAQRTISYQNNQLNSNISVRSRNMIQRTDRALSTN